MPLQFLWDERKARSNLSKHRVDFREAATVFGDRLSLTIEDPAYSTQAERRYVTIGMSS